MHFLVWIACVVFAEGSASPSSGGSLGVDAEKSSLECSTDRGAQRDELKRALQRDLALRRYRERYLRFEWEVARDTRTGKLELLRLQAFGKWGKPLRGENFYLYLDRYDLADRYYHRQLAKGALIAAGVVAIGAGTITAVSRVLSVENKEWQPQHGVLVGALFVLGVGSTTWGLTLRVDPLSNREKLVLADQFNDELRKSLGLSASEVASYSARHQLEMFESGVSRSRGTMGDQFRSVSGKAAGSGAGGHLSLRASF